MPTAASKVTIHMVSSLDGLIAKKDNSIAWMETSDSYEKGVTGENAVAAAALASYVPARRAATIDPIETLRAE